MYQNRSPRHLSLVRTVAAILRAVALSIAPLATGALGVLSLAGCETESFFDPSRTGYFENTPTSMPVLERIDIIEAPEEPLGVNGPPEPQDLIANTLQYRLSPGDVLNIDIYELIAQSRTEQMRRTVDTAGYIRLPTINEVKVNGLTLEELRLEIANKLSSFIRNPVITIEIEQGRSFEFTIQGAIQNPGVYALDKPNFRLSQALALANGAEAVTERVLVVRSMRTEQDVEAAATQPASGTEASGSGSAPSSGGASSTGGVTAPTTPRQPIINNESTPIDIEALINQLGPPSTPPAPPAPPATPQTPSTPPATAPDAPVAPSPTTPAPETPKASPGAVSGKQNAPLIDIDSLEPVVVQDQPVVDRATGTQRPPSSQLSNEGDSFVFDVNSQQWVRIKGTKPTIATPTVSLPGVRIEQGIAATGSAARGAADAVKKKKRDPREIFNTRIIEIECEKLLKGDQSQNIIVRPGDEIYVQFPPIGMVYIDGEIQRPGVFQLPTTGRLTLSRLVATAGGLTAIAIPERVDLVRSLPGGRQAAIRVNLAAIRNMSEPDIVLKRDDQIVIGTNFWATPLAVIRNGFRMTYGFGFLLDRNWGNDVFGPPPQQETINF